MIVAPSTHLRTPKLACKPGAMLRAAASGVAKYGDVGASKSQAAGSETNAESMKRRRRDVYTAPVLPFADVQKARRVP